MKRLILQSLMLALAMAPVVGAEAMDMPTYHQKAGVTCEGCHTATVTKEGRTPTKTECTACHNEDQLVKDSGEKFGVRNPHDSIHFHRDLPCEDCHRQHQPAVNTCTIMCHTFPEMKIPANR